MLRILAALGAICLIAAPPSLFADEDEDAAAADVRTKIHGMKFSAHRKDVSRDFLGREVGTEHAANPVEVEVLETRATRAGKGFAAKYSVAVKCRVKAHYVRWEYAGHGANETVREDISEEVEITVFIQKGAVSQEGYTRKNGAGNGDGRNLALDNFPARIVEAVKK